ncbi:uncharacterized protein FIBRA_04777 [Fibroporia radiculosa]|uniref:Major facilitator superfamily (MFS) profile domain-containing protein n=1 Tax=Fibroporia radiculosa TaxID=599839 RepID=J4HWQ5_9APHY|nr:uncharacterized protein FIBRA_04777 [Fibroporia radiculosa]CCM02672.1 predicted protein [Fibroporia radiculosa]
MASRSREPQVEVIPETYELPVIAGELPTTDEIEAYAAEYMATVTPPVVSVHELAPIDGGWKAWRFCISGFLLEVVTWGFTFSRFHCVFVLSSYGIFQDYYTSNPPFNKASPVLIAAVGTTAIAIQYMEVPDFVLSIFDHVDNVFLQTIFLSLFFERYPDLLQVSIYVGLLIASLSLLLASFVNQIWQLVMLQGVLFGISAGLMYFPILVLLPQWFVQRRGLATGIIFSGSGLGGEFLFVVVHPMLVLNAKHRFRISVPVGVVTKQARIPMDLTTPRLPVPRFQRGQSRPRFIPPQMHFIKTPLFWSLVVSTALQAMSFFSVSLYIAPFVKVISSPLSASIALSLFNSAGVVGQIVVGHLCDRLPYAWIMFISTLGSGMAVFLLWGFAHTLPLVFTFAIIFGGLMGGYCSVGPVAAADCAGNKPEQSSLIWALTYFAKGAAVVIGPIISGFLYDVGRASAEGSSMRYGAFGFEQLEVFVGTCAVATSVTSILVAATRQRVRG